MPKKRALQAGRNKEAPLEIAGSGKVEQEHQAKVFTPVDAEYQRFSELFKGFFEKFTSWNEILEDKKYKRNLDREDTYRDCQILTTPTGLVISILDDAPSGKENPIRVLKMTRKQWHPSESKMFHTEFIIKPGEEGKHLLIDPMDKQPLKEISIEVGYQYDEYRGIRIQTERPDITREGYSDYRSVDYAFWEGKLKLFRDALTDEIATSLINTIDALILHSTSPTLQPERRTTPEVRTPKALPPGRRSPAGR